MSCTSNSQCSPFGGAFCSSKIPRRCECKDITVFDEAEQLCKYRTGLYAPCDSDDVCTIQNSKCSPEGRCVCEEKYVDKQGICVKGLYIAHILDIIWWILIYQIKNFDFVLIYKVHKCIIVLYNKWKSAFFTLLMENVFISASEHIFM